MPRRGLRIGSKGRTPKGEKSKFEEVIPPGVNPANIPKLGKTGSEKRAERQAKKAITAMAQDIVDGAMPDLSRAIAKYIDERLGPMEKRLADLEKQLAGPDT